MTTTGTESRRLRLGTRGSRLALTQSGQVAEALMAAREDAQERLDHLTHLIAQETGAAVCSIYLARRGGSLELCATHGLKQEAVHNTRLQPVPHAPEIALWLPGYVYGN